MCGVVGFLDLQCSMPNAAMADLVKRMALQIESRGPDDAGEWVDQSAGIALGHRRLSIIDLSPMGHQPMISHSSRSVIAYNGEVYNFADVRAELEALGCQFRGHSDTEVLLEACERWGVKRALNKFIGMFAIAFWDRQEKTLTLARDRLGIKPLYWGRMGGVVFFGSQLKAFCPHPAWRGEVDRDALSAYMRHNYIPAPSSIYKNISKLAPGCFLTIDCTGNVVEEAYWDLRAIAREGTRDRLSCSDAEAVDSLDGLLLDAVKKRMVADVPLGAFLSGGIDSSIVAAMMQAQSHANVKTFSIGFSANGYNEAPYAKAVADHLGTDHTELYLDSSHLLDIVPRLPEWYDEPFADSSQLPTYLLSEMTRKHVTIALSGDGGDELFSGYNRYASAERLNRKIERVPFGIRKLVAAGIAGISSDAWDLLFSVLPQRLRSSMGDVKMQKLASVLRASDESSIYRHFLTHWDDPDCLVKKGREVRGVLWDKTIEADIADFSERMQYLDSVTYLPDDILTKVDRASMAVALEARVPILDHRVVEWSWKLPLHMKVRGGEGKWVLRKVLEKYVPKSLTDRPKMGFGVPIEHFLRHELRDWAEALLDERRLEKEGYFHPGLIRRRWHDHLAGRGNFAYPLWTVLMFQAWLEENKSRLI